MPVEVSSMKGNTTLLQLKESSICTTADNQKRIYSSKGHHLVKTECRVIVLFLCTSSDEAVYLYKIS